jgi:hypothetical protein
MRSSASSAAADPAWRRWLRRGVTAILLATLVFHALAVARLAGDPRFAPMVDRTQAELAAAIDRALARKIDAAWVAARIGAGLDASPRDWASIDMAREEALALGIPLPAALADRLDAAEAEDRGTLASARACWGCILDPATCPLSAEMLCSVAVDLTPVGDVTALGRAALAWQAGEPVDRIDAGLAIVGLAATAGALVTAGSTLSVKAGAGFLRAARRAGRWGPPSPPVWRGWPTGWSTGGGCRWTRPTGPGSCGRWTGRSWTRWGRLPPIWAGP